jgi:hypothetical protein
VRSRGYFPKPYGLREQKPLVDTAPYSSSFVCCFYCTDRRAKPGNLPKAMSFTVREALNRKKKK